MIAGRGLALLLAVVSSACRSHLTRDPGARVGAVLHRVERVTCAAGEWQVTLFRANVTQDGASVGVQGITLLGADGARRPVFQIDPVRCDAVAPCDVLDPGNTRTDVLVFRAPPEPSALYVAAPRGQPGPPRAQFALSCSGQ